MPSEDRLQPSLLDRLTDDEPGAQQESRERWVLSFARFREAVIRDLTWLLNTGPLGEIQDLSAYPQAARSVLNYGLSNLTGRSASSLDVPRIERLLKDAIADFEPRIAPETLEVRVVVDKDQMNRNALRLEIHGALWAQPLPQELYLRAEVDLETGHFAVSDRGGKGPA